jgi:hypothetical protein
MIWGIKDNERIKAEPNKKAFCDVCSGELIPKCGKIKVWHWAHKSTEDCDLWSEPESEWHINWKNKFPKECQEVKIGIHRADIKHNDLVIELQNSSISPDEIKQREDYYKKMIWLFNGKKLCAGIELRQKEEDKYFGSEGIYTFRWRMPPKSLWACKHPIIIHMNGSMARRMCKAGPDNPGVYYEQDWKGDYVFLIKRIYDNIPCGGYGELYSVKKFMELI